MADKPAMRIRVSHNSGVANVDVLSLHTSVTDGEHSLYTHPPAIDDAMVERACEAYWGEGWEEPEHEGIAEARRIDARAMLDAALNPQGGRGNG